MVSTRNAMVDIFLPSYLAYYFLRLASTKHTVYTSRAQWSKLLLPSPYILRTLISPAHFKANVSSKKYNASVFIRPN